MLIKYLKGILRREDGATVVEYAMVAPVLLLLLMGTFEFSMMSYANSVLEGATVAAARLVKTGYTNNSGVGACSSTTQTRSQFITCIVQTRVGGLFTNTANLTITAKSYASFSNIGQPEPYTDLTGIGHYVAGDPYTDINGNGQWDSDEGAAGLGGPGDIVVYTVSYPWPLYTPLINSLLGNHGFVTLSASAVVKNEPYSSGR